MSRFMRSKRRRRPHVESLEGRLLLNAGDLDTTFGGTGIVTTDLRVMVHAARSVVVQSDNKIVVAAVNYRSGQGGQNFTLVRYNPRRLAGHVLRGDRHRLHGLRGWQ